MNENVNETLPQENPQAAGMEDDWDGMDLSDVTDEPDEPETEAPETGEGGTPPPDADPQQEEPPAGAEEPETKPQEDEEDQPVFELKQLGGVVRQVGRDEVIALAEKGMGYDHILGERDTAREEVSRLTELESFLKELAEPQGMSVEDLIDSTRAQVLAERENLDPDVALQRVKLDRDRKVFAMEQQKSQRAQQVQAEAEAKRRDGFLRFAREYPDVDPNTIPKEVWDKFSEGADLSDAYSRYENKQLREEVRTWKEKAEKAEQNTKNKARSTGSQTSAGAPPEKDPFDALWYDGN